ncbi:MAG TPA: hypothetical protein VIH99_12680, partial [Bdellovibrionota bacterium]
MHFLFFFLLATWAGKLSQAGVCPPNFSSAGKINASAENSFEVCFQPKKKAENSFAFERRKRAGPTGFLAYETFTLQKIGGPSFSENQLLEKYLGEKLQGESSSGEDWFLKVQEDRLVIAERPEFCSEWIPWLTYDVKCTKDQCAYYPEKPSNVEGRMISGLILEDKSL